ncbi:MAG: hypothetical protein BGO97_01900 [Micrococcales bacterium 70-64]|nr:lactococcin 972 family bacteriocin [Leifsonia sp.]ODU65961.1 MAG: hypothetical protein ABT06_01905 [Leifsonia sp. SCN 70-46]OJX84587.1 MAG: hypothetical protein BGO97_01900 [Micrococcales bacterium 70-64]
MNARKLVCAAAAVAALVLLPVAAAQATSESVGGGFWTYGTNSTEVYSNYHHPSLYHTATACNAGVYDKCHQVAAEPGAWARASNALSWLGGNRAYWNTY